MASGVLGLGGQLAEEMEEQQEEEEGREDEVSNIAVAVCSFGLLFAVISSLSVFRAGRETVGPQAA